MEIQRANGVIDIVAEDEAAWQTRAEALRSLYRENKGLEKKVRVGIANQKIVVRVLELPPLEDPKELEAAVRFQAQDQIPMPLDSAVLDFQPLDIVDYGRRFTLGFRFKY